MLKRFLKNLWNFLKKNKSQKYISNLDHSKQIEDMGLMTETEAILGLIYIKYWANEEEKIKFQEKIKQNENIYQEELKEKYNTEKLFKKKDLIIKDELPVEMKQKTVLQKIISKIKEQKKYILMYYKHTKRYINWYKNLYF